MSVVSVLENSCCVFAVANRIVGAAVVMSTKVESVDKAAAKGARVVTRRWECWWDSSADTESCFVVSTGTQRSMSAS